MVRHRGSIIALALDTQRRIYYTILDWKSSNAKTLDRKNWLKNPIAPPFTNEIAQVGFGITDQKSMPVAVVKNGEEVDDPSNLLKDNHRVPLVNAPKGSYLVGRNQRFKYFFMSKNPDWQEVGSFLPWG